MKELVSVLLEQVVGECTVSDRIGESTVRCVGGCTGRSVWW